MCLLHYLQSSVADPYHVDANVDPDPTSPFFQVLDPMLQNDPLRLPPLHFDADLDPQHCYDGFILFCYLTVYILLGLHGDGEDS